MNRKSVKFPFAVRTVAVMIAVWLLICFAITFVTAGQHLESIQKQTDTMAEYLKQDLRECAGSNKDSVDYKDGLNVAEANAVLRYYRFMKLNEFRKQGAEIDIGLYHIDPEPDTTGYMHDFYEAVPESGVLMAAPFNLYGKIIVFDDVFTEEQITQIEDVVRKVDQVYVSRAIGYVKGRFFYPTELILGNYEHNVLIETDYTDPDGQLKSLEYQDVQVRLADGTVVGGHQREVQQMDTYRSLQAESEEDGVGLGVGGTSSTEWNSYTYSVSDGIASNNYAFKIYVKGNHFTYAMKKMAEFYLLSAFIILLLGCALIAGNNQSIEKRMETEFKRRGMMDSMAHEMKTPLSIIRNYGEIIKEETDESKRQQFTQNIIDEADGLNRAIVSMLDLSKMEAGTYPMELSSLSVRRLAEKELKRAEILAQQKRLQMNLEVAGDERILADEKLIINIISNFLSNAIKHTPEGGHITLKVDCDGNRAHFSVKNQGTPIDDNEIEKIWDSYYGIKSSGKESSGLGLAIVRNACMMHNGSYGCYNEEGGVVFWAKVNSMENRITRAELTTGPVIGVADGNRLDGLLLIAIGLLIQGLAVTWSPTALAMQLITALDREGFWFKMMDYTESSVLCVSIVIMLFGAIDLYKKKIFPKRFMIMAVELCICSVVLMLYGFFYTPTGDYESTAPYIADLALVSVEVVMLILMVLFMVSVFMQCGRIAAGAGRIRLARIIKGGLIISASAFAVWFVLAWKYITLYGNAVIVIFAAVLLIYIWYRLKGKITA